MSKYFENVLLLVVRNAVGAVVALHTADGVSDIRLLRDTTRASTAPALTATIASTAP